MEKRRPYDDLYIYYIQGRVRETEEPGPEENFLGNWVENDTSFLFFSAPSAEAVSRLLKTRPDLRLVQEFHFAYEEWQGEGEGRVRAGDFVILPPWRRNAADADAVEILLDPGVVFGNGLHPTTRDCLRAIGVARRRRSFSTVLDLGTGTGVLAVASAFSGADRVLAVDLNPLCRKTAVRNVRLNGLEAAVQVMAAPAEDFFDEPADLVISNIHYPVIRGLLEKRPFGGEEMVILSGLMRSPYRDIRQRLVHRGFRILREWDHEMTWFTILAEAAGPRGERHV